MLGEHNITYRPRTSVKGQVLANFLAELPDKSPPDASVVETQQEPWTLFTDGSSCVDGSGDGHTLISPEGTEFTYALRFQFAASNNEAEYEALIAGLWIAAHMVVQNEDGPTWMTPIIEYLKEWTLPSDRKEARKLCIKARHYELLEGVLYRRSFLTPWLRCVGPLQADYVIREIHEGSCSMHATISGGQSHTAGILLANDAPGRTRYDTYMQRLSNTSSRDKKPPTASNPNHGSVAILQVEN
nr:reverse transcriptase domain-containing protein [Tanacetum cinerariifolium]